MRDAAVFQGIGSRHHVLQGVDRTRFFCPTSILKILVDNETPIGYGMPKETAAMFANCPAFETLMPPYDWDRKVVVAVGIPVTRHPPHRSVQALLMHTAPTSDVWRQTARLGAHLPVPGTRLSSRPVSGSCVSG